MKKLCILVLLLVFVGTVSAADVWWVNSQMGGGGIYWNNPDNWTADGWVTTGPVPGPTDGVRVHGDQAGGGTGPGPTVASACPTVINILLGVGSTGRADMTVVDGGSITSDYTVTGYASAGLLKVEGGVFTTTTSHPVSDAGGNGTIYQTGGRINIGTMYYNQSNDGSIGHVQLDGGEMWNTVMRPINLHLAGQTMDITGGKLIFWGEDLANMQWCVNLGNLTGYGYNDFDHVKMDYDITNPGYTTVWAVPEPATMLLLGLGGLALIRKRR